MKIAVFCGSRFGARPAYAEAARQLGTWIAREGHSLIFGGEESGLMKLTADAAADGGAGILGVVPNIPFMLEHMYPRLTELKKVPTMFERKRQMLAEADAYICLPGGIGTLDEFGDAMTAIQLEQVPAGRKTVLFNTEGYYELLWEYLRHTAAEGLTDIALLDKVLLSSDLQEIGAFLKGQ